MGRGSAHRSAVGVGHSVRVGGVPLDFVQKAGEPPAGPSISTEARVGLSQVLWVGVGVGPGSSHMFLAVCPLPSINLNSGSTHGVAFNMSFSILTDLVQNHSLNSEVFNLWVMTPRG